MALRYNATKHTQLFGQLNLALCVNYEKAKLVDQLITNLDKPDKNIDTLWMEEAKYELDQAIEYYDFQSAGLGQ